MKFPIRNASLCFLLFLSGLVVRAQDKEETLDAMIQVGMQDWEIPGLVATVVQEGEVVFSKAYGLRNNETKAAVDRTTLFNMGSTTKAVVCMALGILVDRGEIKWEDPVSKHLPEFELSDPTIRNEARVQDLLTHNLGIEGADMLWFMDSTSTKATLQGFRMAKKVYPIRGGFRYNNLMYVAAGEVIRAASGKHWTDFVTSEIFEPLEMTRSVARAASIFDTGNYVTPYIAVPDQGLLEAQHNLSDQIGAAGMIWTCLQDVEHYLSMLTQGGTYKGKQILQPETFNYLFKPHAFVGEASFYPTQQLTSPNWRTYGLGWFQHDYRGHKLDFHTGSITGLIAIAGIIHDKKTAVYVMANRDHAELRHAILYQAMDLWAFDSLQRDWHQEIFELYEGIRKQSEQRLTESLAKRVPDTRTTLSLDSYVGNYTHPMLGEVRVNRKEDGLVLNFNEFATFNAFHWHYDTFRSDHENRYRNAFFIQFHLNEDGKVARLEALGSLFVKSSP